MPQDNNPPVEPVDPFTNPQLCPTDAAGIQINGARFGCSRGGGTRWHGGLDLKAEVGTQLQAIYGGKVTLTRNDPGQSAGLGSIIVIRSGAFSIKYCHLDSITVVEGTDVTAGQAIGTTGKSGNAYPDSVTFKHLHLEVSTDHFATNSRYVDPEPYLKTKYGPNPNNPNRANCPAFVEEELDFIRIDPQNFED